LSSNQQPFYFGLSVKHPIDIALLLKGMEKETDSIIQVVDPKFIASKEHLRLILAQSKESYSRGIVAANKKSMDILLRLLCTKKIEKALHDAGFKPNSRECVILGLCNKDTLPIIEKKIRNYGDLDDRVLEASKERVNFLMTYHGISKNEVENYGLLNMLLEKSATCLIRHFRNES
jgi:tRNA threonylcarbamoyladenosine modification (KEOPS) complex Cgi121 subunit